MKETHWLNGGIGLPYQRHWLNHLKSVTNPAEITLCHRRYYHNRKLREKQWFKNL